MFIVCQNSKYGSCRYRKRFEKIHFTDICVPNQECREKWCCDTRHPNICYYFEKFERCKFWTYCEYMHMESIYWNKALQKIEILKTDISHLKNKNEELERKITSVSENPSHKSVQTDEIVKSSKTTQT